MESRNIGKLWELVESHVLGNEKILAARRENPKVRFFGEKGRIATNTILSNHQPESDTNILNKGSRTPRPDLYSNFDHVLLGNGRRSIDSSAGSKVPMRILTLGGVLI